jgi:hypothetical protein
MIKRKIEDIPSKNLEAESLVISSDVLDRLSDRDLPNLGVLPWFLRGYARTSCSRSASILVLVFEERMQDIMEIPFKLMRLL